VDAFAGYAPTDAFAFKTLQYAKHVTDLPGGLTAPSFAMFINKKKWESLTPADREAITKLSGEALASRLAALDGVDAKVRSDAAAQGVSIKPASPAFSAEMSKLAEPLVQSWLKNAAAAGVDGAAALAFYKQQAQQEAK
jgi:TRAP-type C4-dicarboxylate transport system substrate-binding protein